MPEADQTVRRGPPDDLTSEGDEDEADRYHRQGGLCKVELGIDLRSSF
jgi:hypothetical protein